MSNKNNIMDHLVTLHSVLVSQHKDQGNRAGIETMKQLISDINDVGYMDGLGLQGVDGRFLLIEGQSWQHACRNIDNEITPSFVMWEESAFLSFLESILRSPGKDGSK